MSSVTKLSMVILCMKSPEALGLLFLPLVEHFPAASKFYSGKMQPQIIMSSLSSKPNPNRFCCYGCGAELQFEAPDAAGYVEPDRYALKQRHRQLRQGLCCRCRALSQGQILPAVAEGRLRKAGGNGVTSPEELRAQLLPLRERKALVVLLVDLTDVAGTLLPRVRDLIGANPVVLVGTKVDLLPKDTDEHAVGQWLAQVGDARIGGVIDVLVVSAKNGIGMREASNEIRGVRSGRDVFVMGAANVGKSLFISAFLEASYAGKPPRLPISSGTPGTTLSPIAIDAFSGGSKLYDTPGVHLQHRISTHLLPDELKVVLPRGRMRPYTPPSPSVVPTTFFWGGLARFDVVTAPKALRLSFCAFNLRVHSRSTVLADNEYAAQVGRTLTPPLDPESAEQFGALQLRRSVELNVRPMQQAADIAISGLGWVSVGCLNTLEDTRAAGLLATIDVWVPRGVEVLVRPPMPIAGLPTAGALSRAIWDGGRPSIQDRG
mmetsp:Transcript_46672/g.77203  ORF Transcript_46672/g.77203 Transcript_46672/m.77203 type:complete len:490 (+) Transcript_46672:161-1630(+)